MVVLIPEKYFQTNNARRFMHNITAIKTVSLLDEGEEKVNALLQEGWIYLNSHAVGRVSDPIHGMGMVPIGDDVLFVLGKPRASRQAEVRDL